ncbi:hypothetical protein [Deinococcus planocerae]|uniref:hypothetical protein n=1 Tax=Deinococcus planocerae TaxID=1737569 RepID=UPI001FE7F139|nr:hypothetical protein [Deinococcus planocerae]
MNGSPEGSKWGRVAVLLSTLGASGWVGATPLRLDGLLAVNDAPSPCQGVRVRVFEGSRLRSEATVLPSGEVKPVGAAAKAPRFEKGRAYNLQATCVSASGTFQNSELSFRAEGRTVMVVFTKAGFQFRRGGLGY